MGHLRWRDGGDREKTEAGCLRDAFGALPVTDRVSSIVVAFPRSPTGPRPSARRDGPFVGPASALGAGPSRASRGLSPCRPFPPTSVTLRPVKGRPFPVLVGLLLVALVTVLAVGQLGIIGGASGSAHQSTAVPTNAPGGSAPATTGTSSAPAPSEGVTGGTPSSSPAPATPGPHRATS